MKISIVLALILMLNACSAGDTEQEPIKIGQLAALTSFGSTWGMAEKNGVALAVKEANDAGGVNGKPIEIVIEDTQSDFTKTLSAYRKLHDVNGLDVIIGPTWNEFTQVILPAAKDDGSLIMSPSSSFDKVNVTSPLFFTTFHSLRWINAPINEDIEANQYRRVAIVYDQNAFTQAVHDFFVEEMERQGVEVLSFETNPDAKDYRTQITKIRDSDVDAVYVLLAFWPNIGEFMKQASTQGLEAKFYTQIDVENEQYIPIYGRYSEGMLYPYPEAGSPSFNEKYKAEFGIPASSPSGETAYDAANLLIAALRSGANTPQKISAYLRRVKNYDGVSGPITFDEYGQVAYKRYFLKAIRNGTHVRY
jgi:branched-chain amino acid transport system substrate-binding protein